MRLLLFAVVCACGGPADAPPPDGSTPIDSSNPLCEAQPAIGQFVRRMGNPRILAGTTFTDGQQDIAIFDPDVRFDTATARYELYYSAAHALTVNDPSVQVIRHASSPDRVAWTVDDVPSLAASTDINAWDHTHTEAPTVVMNPTAPADRRYLMLYSGASRTFPFPGYTFPEFRIGAAFSADGRTFTRITAAQSPHGQDGLVITAAQVYGGAVGATVSDPELAFIDGVYHLWFSSFACEGASCANRSDFGISYATSADGITWTIVAAPVKSLLRASSDDTSGGQQPSVTYDAVHCKWEMWLTNDLTADTTNQLVALDNMRGVWKAESNDALSWSINYIGRRDIEWTAPTAGERLGVRTGADIAQNSSGRLMLYTGFDDQSVPAGYTLPTASGTRAGVMTINVATRDLP